MNKIILIGRLTKDPDLRYTQSGHAVVNVPLAVDRRFAAQGQPDVDFIPIVAWKKLAENLAEYMRKGSMVAVEGELHLDSYEDKKGIKRLKAEVLAQNIKFLDSRSKENRGAGSDQATAGTEIDYDPDELPF
ncbi:single-stranded DNA-binding protein [Peptococcus simiae]|uniref:single-stranded DNA-binding protein n=1 Tax=Peptococcus simiae TaxID=1643805 RepID=UPI0039808EC8